MLFQQGAMTFSDPAGKVCIMLVLHANHVVIGLVISSTYGSNMTFNHPLHFSPQVRAIV